jgi:hypothetical protein
MILKSGRHFPERIRFCRTDLVFTNKSWRAFRLDTTIKDNATFPALSPFGNQINWPTGDEGRYL